MIEYTPDRIFTRSKITSILDSIKGKTFREIDSKGLMSKASDIKKITGIAGDVIEQSVLGCSPDSGQRPDLLVDGIPTELKTIGIRMKRENGKMSYEAKEPMTVTAVSIPTITGEVFLDSSLWHKLNHLLIVFYEYASESTVPASAYADFPILGYCFHEFTEDDREILEHDWTAVRDFITELNGFPTPENEYGRLSYELRPVLSVLDTSPKYPHPPRFRLKRSFVTSIVQQSLSGRKGPPSVSFHELDMACRSMTKVYGGRTIKDLAMEFGIEGASKSIASAIVSRMFEGSPKRISDIELFKKLSLNVKTVKLSSKGKRTEDMKLFIIDFGEISMDGIEFEDSEFYEYFSEHQLLCPIFEESDAEGILEDARFMGFKRLFFTESFIQNDVRSTWEDIRRIVVNGELRCTAMVDAAGRPRINGLGEPMMSINLPKSRDGAVFVRGGGANSRDRVEIVPGVLALRQYLWIKGKAITSLLDGLPFL